MSNVPVERIPVANWWEHTGHTRRYEWAAAHILPGEVVNDIACGVGYGSALLGDCRYHGYDRPGVPDRTMFFGAFHECDLDDRRWSPAIRADVTICFETLEHVHDPKRLAQIVANYTRRAVFVSTPTQPTKHLNPYHLHDFTEDEVPAMFPGFEVAEAWEQPDELCHVWMLERWSL